MMCFRYKRLLIPYSEGVLDRRSRARVERHLEKCQRCAAELRAVRAVSSALRQSDTPAAAPAPDLWAKVSARIADEPAPRRRVWIPQAASAVVAAVLVAVIGFGVMRPGQAPQVPLEPQAARVSVKPLPKTPAVVVCKSMPVLRESKTPAPATKRTMTVRKPSVRKPVMVASLPETHDAYAETNSHWYDRPAKSELKSDTPALPSDAAKLHYDSDSAPTHDQPGDDMTLKKESRVTAISDALGTVSNGITGPRVASVPCEPDSTVSSPAQSQAVVQNQIAIVQADQLQPTLETAVLLAELHQKAGALKSAAEEREAFLKRKPHDKSALLYLLAAFKLTGDNSDAASIAQRLIDDDPRNSQTYYFELAQCRERMGDKNAALESYKRAVEGRNFEISTKAQDRVDSLSASD